MICHIYKWLLIVPYGIETASFVDIVRFGHLLIVPYGIETNKKSLTAAQIQTFNRTLWN